MNPRELRRFRVIRDSQQHRRAPAFREFELRPLPHALVGMAKTRHEFSVSIFLKTRLQQTVGFDPLGTIDRTRRIDPPDRPESVEWITANPIRQKERAVRVPRQPDAHDAGVHHAGVHHLEGSALGLGAKCPQLAGRKFIQKKRAALGRTERCAGIETKTRRAIRVTRERG